MPDPVRRCCPILAGQLRYLVDFTVTVLVDFVDLITLPFPRCTFPLLPRSLVDTRFDLRSRRLPTFDRLDR